MHAHTPGRQKVWREAATPTPKVACRCLLCRILPGTVAFGDHSLDPRHTVAFQKHSFIDRPSLLIGQTVGSTSNQTDPHPAASGCHLRKFRDRAQTRLFPFLLLSKQLPLVRQIAIRSFHTERFAPIWVCFFHFPRALGESPRTFVFERIAETRRHRSTAADLGLPSLSSVFPSPAHHSKVGLAASRGG